jgi:hypothetical protein
VVAEGRDAWLFRLITYLHTAKAAHQDLRVGCEDDHSYRVPLSLALQDTFYLAFQQAFSLAFYY